MNTVNEASNSTNDVLVIVLSVDMMEEYMKTCSNRAHVLNPLNKVTFNPDYKNNEIVMGRVAYGRFWQTIK